MVPGGPAKRTDAAVAPANMANLVARAGVNVDCILTGRSLLLLLLFVDALDGVSAGAVGNFSDDAERPAATLTEAHKMRRTKWAAISQIAQRDEEHGHVSVNNRRKWVWSLGGSYVLEPPLDSAPRNASSPGMNVLATDAWDARRGYV